jgi:hypothetical protein
VEGQGERIAKLEEGRTSLDRRIDALERDVDQLKSWKAWLVGGFAVAAVFVGIFADKLKQFFTSP